MVSLVTDRVTSIQIYADECSIYGIYASSAGTKLRFNTTTNCATGVFGGTSEGGSDN
jgi:hypothetical protein